MGKGNEIPNGFWRETPPSMRKWVILVFICMTVVPTIIGILIRGRW